MRWLKLLLAVGLLWPLPALGTDGDACDADDFAAYSKGKVRPAWCVLLCDGVAADGACGDFDLGGFAGVPDQLHFALGTTTSCSAMTATFGTAYVSGGPEHTLGATTAIAIGGTTRIVVDTQAAGVGRIIATDITNEAGCGTQDILLLGYEVDKP